MATSIPEVSGPGLSAPQAAQHFPQEPAYWRELLRDYATSRLGVALFCLLTSVGGYIAVSAAMYFALRDVSVLLMLGLLPLSSAFLLRSFIVFHDCAHGSFFASRTANTWVGRATAAMVVMPFSFWRHEHNVHHATSGDLDKRGVGDVAIKTLQEYWDSSRMDRLAYRLFRNPLVMFGVGPLYALIIGPRFLGWKSESRFRNSMLLTDAALAVAIGLLVYAIGVDDLALIWAPPALLAASVGVWLFYVQHQFEDVYWQRGGDWSYADAALRGSSFLKLPAPLAWATGNIGYHHIHHLSSKVPFYNLPRTHRENEIFQSVPVLTLTNGLRCTRLKLYDESNGRLITWAQEAAQRRSAAPLSSLIPRPDAGAGHA
jgi:omega-6 fatty acid desaturase (delta-12 desaturase)